MMIAVFIVAAALTVVVIGAYKYAYQEEQDKKEHAEQLESYCEGLYYEGMPRKGKGEGNDGE